MPVIDLADYLGMPQQAPANPVFNQTRKSTGVASLDREIDDFYKGAAAIDQLRSLQRQAPVFEAQKAQIAYDKVAQDARDLRMKQEIEAQVERAANELAGGNLNPESEDFGAKYRDLATRNPLAFSDPRFSNVAGLYAAQNQNYQAARKQQMDAERAAAAKADEELRTAIGGFLEYGGDANLVPSIKSVQQAKYLEGQMRKAARDAVGTRGGAKDASLQMMQKDYELVDKDWNEMKKEGENVIYDANGVEMPNPEFQKLGEERKILRDKLRGFYQSKYSPAQTPVAATKGGTVIPFRPPEAPQAAAPFRQTMKDLAAPKAENILKVDESEVLQGINDPSADENTYMAAIDSGNNSLEVKKQALAKLQQFAKSPPPRSDLTVGEAIRRRANLQALAEQAKQEVDAYPVVQQYNKAWSGIKSTMDKTLDEFAKSISSSKEQVINSLRSGELIQGIPGYEVSDNDQGGVSVYRLLSDFFADKMGQEKSPGMNRIGLGQTVEELEGFKKSPFADKMGMRGPLGFGGSKTWSDVLNVYLSEKSGSPSQSPQPAQESIVEISTEEEVDALPKGSKFRGPDGKVRIK